MKYKDTLIYIPHKIFFKKKVGDFNVFSNQALLILDLLTPYKVSYIDSNIGSNGNANKINDDKPLK